MTQTLMPVRAVPNYRTPIRREFMRANKLARTFYIIGKKCFRSVDVVTYKAAKLKEVNRFHNFVQRMDCIWNGRFRENVGINFLVSIGAVIGLIHFAGKIFSNHVTSTLTTVAFSGALVLVVCVAIPVFFLEIVDWLKVTRAEWETYDLQDYGRSQLPAGVRITVEELEARLPGVTFEVDVLMRNKVPLDPLIYACFTNKGGHEEIICFDVWDEPGLSPDVQQ